MNRAAELVDTVECSFDGSTAYSVEEYLRSALSLEEDREKRVEISLLLSDFKQFYQGLAASRQDASAQVVLRIAPDRANLTLSPPRSGGRHVDFDEVMRRVHLEGITEGLSQAAVQAAVEKVVKKEETIWLLQIASSTPSEPGEDATIEFKTPLFDKSIFFTGDPVEADLATFVENVEAGETVAEVRPATPGKPGVDVRGEESPPIPGKDLQLRLGAGLQRSGDGRSVVALVNGTVVLGDDSVDIVPFYVVKGDLEAGQDVRQNGHVMVTGSVTGPVSVRAEDIFIGGSAEAASLSGTGDIYVGGGIVGKKTGRVEADGRVFARSISDATVQAFGDVTVRTSITYSEVASNGVVRVVAERGALVGGTVSALKGIETKNVGSDFGTYTTTAAGVDFLTPKRIERIEKRIREYEDNLSKIDLLKRKLAEAKVDVSKLPPEKQDLYISVLQKEIRTREELNSLRRSREKFDRAITDFLEASIRILENLHPPVKVQIGQTIQEIRERMEKVTLVLDGEKQIHVKREG
ncbi:MAG: DUF342 domain-containing protein [Planctomycetota bacterium]